MQPSSTGCSTSVTATASSGRSAASVLVHGRFDFAAPLDNAWAHKRAWPEAQLVVVDDAGHSDSAGFDRELRRATDRFASVGHAEPF